jgi:pyruvate kinase
VRRTKIVATIGPASEAPETLAALVEAGVDVARIGFAHGTPAENLARVALVREIAADRGRVVAVMADLPGPKVRAGTFATTTTLGSGVDVALVPGNGPSDASRITVEYTTLLEDLRPGDRVSLGDGGVVLTVTAVTGTEARARVLHGGSLRGRPGVHLPAGRVRLSTPTAEDLEHLRSCIDAGVDIVAVSFVRRASDLRRVREAAGDRCPMLVAKIETPQAVANLDEILEEADGVMVARGDLGTECPIEDVPHLQKAIIRACLASGRPVVTATQMLESMTTTTVPTRAEAADVANAVLDGTDALMLSGETAVGVDPPNAVRTMARIAVRAEQEQQPHLWRHAEEARHSTAGIGGVTWAMTHAAWQAARDADAAAIICCTWSGGTVRALASLRPAAPILGMSPNPDTVPRLALSWGAIPMAVPEYTSSDEMVANAVRAAREAGHVRSGQTVVVLAGSPHGATGARNDLLRLLTV